MRKIQKILVPLDGSKNSVRALQAAISIAVPSNASITGMHVVSLPEALSSRAKQHYRKTAKGIVSSASATATKSQVGFTPIVRFDGYPGREIVEYAKSRRFDLIVIGSRGPHPIAEMFLGSVANYVLNKSKIPVLLVK